MKKKIKNLLTAALVLSILFSLLLSCSNSSSDAGEKAKNFSIGDQTYESLGDAFAAAEAYDTIVLLKDVTVPAAVYLLDCTVPVCVDLNGYNLTVQRAESKCLDFYSGYLFFFNSNPQKKSSISFIRNENGEVAEFALNQGYYFFSNVDIQTAGTHGLIANQAYYWLYNTTVEAAAEGAYGACSYDSCGVIYGDTTSISASVPVCYKASYFNEEKYLTTDAVKEDCYEDLSEGFVKTGNLGNYIYQGTFSTALPEKKLHAMGTPTVNADSSVTYSYDFTQEQ